MVIFMVLVSVSAVKLYSATQLGYLGDEPDDFANISKDIQSIKTFFDNTISAEQSRLPHIVTLPFIYFAGNEKLFAARVVSILAFNAFLIVFYLILRLNLSRSRSMFGFIAAACSSFLFSYSLLAMTSSNSLYIFLSALSIYLYLRQTKKGNSKNSKQVATLGMVFGLAMAAKLFGVIVLTVVMVYDFIRQKQWKNLIEFDELKKITKSMQFIGVLVFYIIWLGVNLLPVSSALKLSIFVIAIPIISLYFIYFAILENFKVESFIRWVYLTLVAGMFLVISSPIYLNFKNVLGIFDWSEKWNSVNIIVNPSIYDPFITIGIKFGLIACIVLVFTILFLLFKKRLITMFKEYGLLFLIFGVFSLIFMLVTNYFAWYPLVIFWILYIPLCYVFPKKFNKNSASLLIGLALLVCIPLYETYRYLNLFPNAQTDGAQYGEEYVGWNKPGFITFEGMPLLRDYILSGQVEDENIIAKCVLIPEHVDKYRRYVLSTINIYMKQEGVDNFKCIDAESDIKFKYVITSNYTSDSFINSLSEDYIGKKEFYVNTVNVATIWEKND